MKLVNSTRRVVLTGKARQVTQVLARTILSLSCSDRVVRGVQLTNVGRLLHCEDAIPSYVRWRKLC